MDTNIQYLSLGLTLVFLLFLIELVRRKKIKERLALIWFVAAGVLSVFSLFKDLIVILAKLFEIDYAPLVIIPIITFIGTFIGLFFSYLFSKQSKELKKITQEIALLRHKVEKLENDGNRE
jgi:hypothetical protein